MTPIFIIPPTKRHFHHKSHSFIFTPPIITLTPPSPSPSDLDAAFESPYTSPISAATMPRPNRYHPYTRNNSPRFPTTATIPQLPFTPPADAEQSSARPYQYISPGQIRGRTADGKALVATSAYQAPDGTFHVQMQVMSFPSQDARLQTAYQQHTPMPSPPMMQFMDNQSMSGFGIVQAEQTTQSRKGSMGSVTSQDGRSIRSVSEECAAFVNDEDAEGEVVEDPVECRRLAILQQQRIMGHVKAQMDAAFAQ